MRGRCRWVGGGWGELYGMLVVVFCVHDTRYDYDFFVFEVLGLAKGVVCEEVLGWGNVILYPLFIAWSVLVSFVGHCMYFCI